MKRLKLWIAIVMTLIIIATLVIWTQNLSPKPWITVLVWAAVIIVLQLILIYIIVTRRRDK